MDIANNIALPIDGELSVVIPRGESYPFKRTCSYGISTFKSFSDSAGTLRIPVYESVGGDGHNYSYLGCLLLVPDQRCGPEIGYDIEFTFVAREPGMLRVEAYIPVLDVCYSSEIQWSKTILLPSS